jgi:hypothetical protein
MPDTSLNESVVLSEPVATPENKDKVSSFWINDTTGNPSMSATFATVAFVVTTASYALSIFEKIGPISFKKFDPVACSAYLVPVLSLYFGRRWTEKDSNAK